MSKLKLLLGAMLGLSVASALGAFNVRYNFIDFTQNPQGVKRVTITPLLSYTVNSTNIVTGDRIVKTVNSGGSVTVSNMLPGSYKVEFTGSFTPTIFTNSFGTNTTGTVDASDPAYLTVSTELPDGASAYSKAAADARFYYSANPAAVLTANPTMASDPGTVAIGSLLGVGTNNTVGEANGLTYSTNGLTSAGGFIGNLTGQASALSPGLTNFIETTAAQSASDATNGLLPSTNFLGAPNSIGGVFDASSLSNIQASKLIGAATNLPVAGLTGDPLAVAYAITNSISDPSAVSRASGFFAHHRRVGLLDEMVDCAFLASDMNNPSAPISAIRFVAGTNTASITSDRFAMSIPSTSNRSQWPLNLSSWYFTLVVDMIGVTNVIGTTFCDWGVYNSANDYVIHYNSTLQSRQSGSFSDNGAVTDPYSGDTLMYDGRERIWATEFDNTNFWGQYIDNVLAPPAASNALKVIASTPSRLVFGQRWNGGSTYDLGGPIKIRAWAIYNRVLTTNELVEVQRAFRYLDWRKMDLVVGGDSTVAPSGALRPQTDWPWQFSQFAGNNNLFRFYNHARGGWTTAQLSAEKAWRFGTFAPTGAVENAWFILAGGPINSIGGGATVEATTTDFTNILYYAQTNGFQRVDAQTVAVILTNSPSTWTEALSTNVFLFNSNLIARPWLYNNLYRKDNLLNSNDIATLSYDGWLHLGGAGNQIVAQQIQGSIRNITNGSLTLQTFVNGQFQSLR